MVKNREELLKVAESNSAQMKNHLRKAVRNFLSVQRVKPEELAYVLGITNREMNQIIEGDGNVTVDVLSKILVATDLAVEIKPVRNTPLGGYGPRMPRSGGYPGPGGIPVDENGRPLPPPPGWPRPDFMGGVRHREERANDDMREVPMETTGPARDSRGRFVKKTSATKNRPSATQRPTYEENAYDGLSDADLINIIRSNIWDGEIDVERASHSQLAEFVANKERIMRERTEQPRNERREETPKVGGSNSVAEFLEMLGNVAKEAENNPALAEAINRFMPRKG